MERIQTHEDSFSARRYIVLPLLVTLNLVGWCLTVSRVGLSLTDTVQFLPCHAMQSVVMPQYAIRPSVSDVQMIT